MTKINPSTGAAVKGVLRSAGASSTAKSATAKAVTHTTDNSKTEQQSSWQDGLHRLVKPWKTMEPMTAKEQGDLINILQGAFGEKLAEKSSTQPVDQHFEGLFTGLGVLQSQSSKSLLPLKESARIRAISECKSQSVLLQMFDELYYHGKLSKSAAVAVLRNKNLKDIMRIYKLVSSGGSLIKWSNLDRHIFKLQTANRCFALNQRGFARELIIDCFESEWVPIMRKMQLDSRSFVGLGRALLALNGRELLLQQVATWNHSGKSFQESTDVVVANLFIPLWTACIQVKDYEAAAQIINTAVKVSRGGSVASGSNVANTPALFAQFVSIIHSHYSSSNTRLGRFLHSHPLDRILTLPIDVQKPLDGTVLNQMLDYCRKLQEHGFQELVSVAARPLDATLQQALSVGESYDMISLALAVQKLQVLESQNSKHSTEGGVSRRHGAVFEYV